MRERSTRGHLIDDQDACGKWKWRRWKRKLQNRSDARSKPTPMELQREQDEEDDRLRGEKDWGNKHRERGREVKRRRRTRGAPNGVAVYKGQTDKPCCREEMRLVSPPDTDADTNDARPNVSPTAPQPTRTKVYTW